MTSTTKQTQLNGKGVDRKTHKGICDNNIALCMHCMRTHDKNDTLQVFANNIYLLCETVPCATSRNVEQTKSDQMSTSGLDFARADIQS